jgi:hypothetical protein
MRYLSIVFIVAAAFCTVSSTSLAQSTVRTNHPPKVVSPFDRDGDGRLNAAERKAMLKAMADERAKRATNAPPAAFKKPSSKEHRQERIDKALK